MALSFPASVHSWSFIRVNSKGISNKRSNLNNFSVLQATKFVVKANLSGKEVVRRSGNYRPTFWGDDFIECLKSDYVGESYNEAAIRLVGEVRVMLDNVMDPLEKLELVDTMQRLGLSYHFENETKRILESIRADQGNVAWKKDNLYATALEFRLLRQHGYKVTSEVFSSFMDETGNFKGGLCDDYKGMLNLYEAFYLSVEGEGILDKARDFAIKHLKEYMKENKDEYLSLLVEHALEVPVHWRVPRLEARWFIDMYERRDDMNPILLELAKLDFNIVQAVHQDDLRYSLKWWRDISLREKLPFARDRLMELYFATVCMASNPQFGNLRRIQTKIQSHIVTIDDMYDVYGTLDELELFTQVVERWDINAMELLPEYMKICFLALYNSINLIAYDTLKEHGLDSIHFLKKVWADLCKSYLLEAKWYHSGYIPTLQEYIDNAWISISVPVLLAHAYLVTNSTTKECLECFNEYSNIIYCSSIILRLANDLGTSSNELRKGDVSKSIQCYMHETGASEEEARAHVRKLIDATWRKMNEHRLAHSPLSSQTFIQFVVDLVRMTEYIYQHHDGYGIVDHEMTEYIYQHHDGYGIVDHENKKIYAVSSLFILPISFQFSHR